jgi:membrane-bound lytic murein transglycosylase D
MGLPVVELVAPDAAPETIDLTSEPEELFQRMRQGFSMPNINNALVLHHQQWYLNHPESLRRMVERSSRYLHHIVEEIEKRGMPMELALLPMVESAYNPTAYSRSHASGLWQFVPATGKQYKLEQNWWVDERRDIVASTAAASITCNTSTICTATGTWRLPRTTGAKALSARRSTRTGPMVCQPTT